MKLSTQGGAIALSILMTIAILALIPLFQNAASSSAATPTGEKLEVVAFTPEPQKKLAKETPTEEPEKATPELQNNTATSGQDLAKSNALNTPQQLSTTPEQWPSPPLLQSPPPPAFSTNEPSPWAELPPAMIVHSTATSWAWTPTTLQEAESTDNNYTLAKAMGGGSSTGQGNQGNFLEAGSTALPMRAISLYRPAPPMPVLAKLRNINGTVEVQFVVNSKGECSDIVAHGDYEMFEIACLEAMKSWKFKPILDKNGNTLPVIQHQTIIFSP